MLAQLQFDATNRTIGEVVSWTTLDDGYYPIELNPAYQRPAVWTEQQKRNLVKSVLMNLPIGVIFINHRDPVRFTVPPRMVDGQQRLRALMAFMNDEFDIPTEWVDDREFERERAAARNADPANREESKPFPAIPDDYDKPTIRFSELTMRGQRSFRSSTIAVYETKLPTEEQEAELFLLINFGGGEAQTVADQARAEAVAGRSTDSIRADNITA